MFALPVLSILAFILFYFVFSLYSLYRLFEEEEKKALAPVENFPTHNLIGAASVFDIHEAAVANRGPPYIQPNNKF